MEIRFNKEMLEKFLTENKMTKKQFCDNCRISVTTLNRYLKGSANRCKITVVIRICDFAGWATDDFCVRIK